MQFRLIYKCAKAITTNDALRSVWGKAKLGLEWLLFRTGALAVGINQGDLFTRLMANAKSPDIQFHVATLSADMAGGKGGKSLSGFTMSVCQCGRQGRGRIALASSRPARAAARARRLSATAVDRDYAVASIRSRASLQPPNRSPR